MRTWESRSSPEPNVLLGRRARRATPRSFPMSRVKKLTIKSASRKGYVRRTNVSLTRAGIDSAQNNRVACGRRSQELFGLYGDAQLGQIGSQRGFAPRADIVIRDVSFAIN